MRQVGLLYLYVRSIIRARIFWAPAFCIACFLFLTHPAIAVTSNVVTGNWSAPATWVGGIVPAAGQDVIIASGATVNLDIYTPTLGNVQVNANGKLDIKPFAVSTLSFGGNLTVNGTLTNTGGIEVTGNNKNFILGPAATYVHNPLNNTLLDESIFIKMVETFDPSSYLTISKWFDLSVPLGSPSRVSSSFFGNVI
jgi:hypothetical protein